LFCDGLIEQLTRQQLVDKTCVLGRAGLATDKIARTLVQDAFASNSRDNMSLLLLRAGVFEAQPLSSRAILNIVPLPCTTPLLLAPPQPPALVPATILPPSPPRYGRAWFVRHAEFLMRYAYPAQTAHIQQLEACFAQQERDAASPSTPPLFPTYAPDTTHANPLAPCCIM
jgi:hypothetical protein